MKQNQTFRFQFKLVHTEVVGSWISLAILKLAVLPKIVIQATSKLMARDRQFQKVIQPTLKDVSKTSFTISLIQSKSASSCALKSLRVQREIIRAWQFIF